MNFEAQLDELYIEITNHISDMIPERWENVCLNAFIGDNKRYVYFHYMVPGEDDPQLSMDITWNFDVSEEVFDQQFETLCELLMKLRHLFVVNGRPPFGTCVIEFNHKGQKQAVYENTDWDVVDFRSKHMKNYYFYKNFGHLPKQKYDIEQMYAIHRYAKTIDDKNEIVTMEFKEKINYLYRYIGQHIMNMIPVSWENVYAVAYMTDGGGSVYFYYTVPDSDELFYSMDIPKNCHTSSDEFSHQTDGLYDLFEELRYEFIRNKHKAWSTCEFDFTIKGKLNVLYQFIDWDATEFGSSAYFNYYRYKKFGILPKLDYELKELYALERYMKEYQKQQDTSI